MALQIRDLDLASDDEVRAAHDVYVRAETLDGRPWTHPEAYDGWALGVREPRITEFYESYVALEDGRVVGVATQGFWTMSDLDKTWLNIHVEPGERRRGVGSALLEHGIVRARARGRTEVVMDSTSAVEQRDQGPAYLFAKRNGFQLANTEVLRTLRVPVDGALLDEIAADAATHHAGYEIVSYAGSMADELQQSWCDVVNRLGVDAPTGETEWEVSAITPESYREGSRRLESTGRLRVGSLAVLDGEVVGETHIVVTDDDPRAEQWSTIVAPAHRGHRLGAAVKVANLRQLQRLRPDVVELSTQNAETNAFMVSINERLGFELTALCPEFHRRL